MLGLEIDGKRSACLLHHQPEWDEEFEFYSIKSKTDRSPHGNTSVGDELLDERAVGNLLPFSLPPVRACGCCRRAPA